MFLAVFGALEIATSEGETGALTMPIAAGVAAQLGLLRDRVQAAVFAYESGVV